MGKWARRVSNLRPLACEASALPLSYAPQGTADLTRLARIGTLARGGAAWHPVQGTMPNTVKDERRVDGPTNEGEEICHIVTEADPDTALCGKDVTGWPWNPPWPYCVVCLDLMHDGGPGG